MAILLSKFACPEFSDPCNEIESLYFGKWHTSKFEDAHILSAELEQWQHSHFEFMYMPLITDSMPRSLTYILDISINQNSFISEQHFLSVKEDFLNECDTYAILTRKKADANIIVGLQVDSNNNIFPSSLLHKEVRISGKYFVFTICVQNKAGCKIAKISDGVETLNTFIK